VLLRVLVDESGRVAEVRIVRAVELLTETAVNAVRAAACTPARRGDVPVKEWVEIPIRFELPK
jgi:TonB family protein